MSAPSRPWIAPLALLVAATCAIASGVARTEDGPFTFVPSSLRANPLAAPAGASAPSRFGAYTSSRWSHGRPFERQVLDPVGVGAVGLEPQPHRQHPLAVALSGDGTRIYVALAGNEAEPEDRVAVVDTVTEQVTSHIPLALPAHIDRPATSPYAMALHPDGRHLLVTARFANVLIVIDTAVDAVVAEIPLDFYGQGIALDADGDTAYVADRYLDQVLLVDLSDGPTAGHATEVGGLDDAAFFAASGIHDVLQRRCGSCHTEDWPGGFYAGEDASQSFASLLPHVIPGDADRSRLLRTVIPGQHGGFADATPAFSAHAGGTIFDAPDRDPDHAALHAWIEAARIGPGIPVSNENSKPDALALSADGRHLFVANSGTQDVSIVHTATQQEVGGVYLQNAAQDLAVYNDPATGRDLLLIATMGIGYGVIRERDPWGGESWDPDNRAAQYTVWRDCDTGGTLPRDQQHILGPFDAADGTAEIKFRDLQNDLVVVDLDRLAIPDEPPADGLQYLSLPYRYEAHRDWVRYTSDTAESTAGDIKGDIPPDLMRVQGALPTAMLVQGDHLYVVMSGSNLVQEWRIDAGAHEPSDVLVPLRTFPTGHNPMRIAAGLPRTPSEGLLYVSNFLGGTLSVLDLTDGSSHEVVVDPSILQRPVPDTNAERGELMVRLSLFSADGDTSCAHCHARDLGDGRPWGVSQVVGQEFVDPDGDVGQFVIGGTMAPPQMRNLLAIQPFFFEGVISVFEPRSMIMEHTPADDFARAGPHGDPTWLDAHYELAGVDDIQANMDSATAFEADLEERRDQLFRELTMAAFGKAMTLRDFVRFIGEWQIHEPRLLPNPYDPDHPSRLRGQALFSDPQVGCVSCHPPPSFAKKDLDPRGTATQSFMPQVMFTPRDGSFTLIGMNRLDHLNGYRRDLEPWDVGRCEETEGQFTSFPLRGIWDRPPAFLHSGIARTLREVVATPGHRALRRYRYEPLIGGNPERPGRHEVGFNATFHVPDRQRYTAMHEIAMARIGHDTHGGTSHLRASQVDDLVCFLKSIE